jgi:hypothetical protein
MVNRNGNIIGPKQERTFSSAVGIYDTFDQYTSKLNNSWPYTPAVTSLSESSTSLNETTNRDLTITVNAQGFADGATLYWTINQVSGTVVAGDFVEGLSGSFSLSGDFNSSTGDINLTIATDFTPDGTDVFNVSVRSGSTSGPILATSQNITISDTSTEAPAGENITSSFYSIAEFQNNDGASDTSSNYSVSEVQQGYSGNGRLYLIHKATGATTFYNDAPIACIQVLDSSGTSINEQWWFGASGNGQGWTTHLVEVNLGPIGTGVNITPSQAASNYTYATSVVNGATADRFTLATSTGSSATGAVDGISQPTGPMTLGEKTVPQGLGTYYMYRETSGAQVPFCTLCRSPSRLWTGGEIIRIAYIIGNVATTNYYTPTDTFFVGIA